MALDKLLKEATDDYLVQSDWEKNMQICELIYNLQQAEQFTAVIQQRLSQVNKPRSKERAIELLQCGMQNSYWVVRAVHKPPFQHFLIDLVRSSVIDFRLKNTLLNLIRAWGIAFNSASGLPNFSRTLDFLQRKGIAFPAASEESNYSPPPQPVVVDSRPAMSRNVVIPTYPEPVSSFSNYMNSPDRYGAYPSSPPNAQPYSGSPQPYGQPYGQPFSHQPVYPPAPQHAAMNPRPNEPTIQKMTELLSSQTLIRELLTAIDPQRENVQDNELLAELLNNCKEAQKSVVENIDKIVDENLLNMMLLFNDQMLELNQIFSDLLHSYQNRGTNAHHVSITQEIPVQHSSSFTGISEPLTLDLGFSSLNAYEQPFLPDTAEDDNSSLEIQIPAPSDYKPPKVENTKQQFNSNPIPEFTDLSISDNQNQQKQSNSALNDDFDAFFDELATRKSPTNSVSSPQQSDNLLDLLNSPAPMTQNSIPQQSFPSYPFQSQNSNSISSFTQPTSFTPSPYYQSPTQSFQSPITSPQQNSPISSGNNNNQNPKNTPDVFKDLLL